MQMSWACCWFGGFLPRAWVVLGSLGLRFLLMTQPLVGMNILALCINTLSPPGAEEGKNAARGLRRGRKAHASLRILVGWVRVRVGFASG